MSDRPVHCSKSCFRHAPTFNGPLSQESCRQGVTNAKESSWMKFLDEAGGHGMSWMKPTIHLQTLDHVTNCPLASRVTRRGRHREERGDVGAVNESVSVEVGRMKGLPRGGAVGSLVIFPENGKDLPMSLRGTRKEGLKKRTVKVDRALHAKHNIKRRRRGILVNTSEESESGVEGRTFLCHSFKKLYLVFRKIGWNLQAGGGGGGSLCRRQTAGSFEQTKQ